MSVADVSGVKLSGLLFDAGTVYSPVLLRAADDECWLPSKASAIVPLSTKGVGPDMKVSEQERRLHDAQGHKLGFFAAALGAFAIAAAICNGAMPTPFTPESIWPTQEWRTSSPEEEGMDSKELAKLIDWGVGYKFDSLLIVRHGKIVLEAYYAPYAAGMLHAQYSVTKSVIGTLTGIAFKEGLSEFADSVSGSVKSDTTIPADTAGEKLLANKIRDVSTDKAH
jgi:hypothetical protein